MLSCSPRYDLFRFQFSKDFLPKEVEEKWRTFINKDSGVITTPIDYLNESIKSLTIPGISDVNITQNQHSTNTIVRQGPSRTGLGRINVEPNQNNIYVGSSNPLDKIERKITVTFRMNQGLYNYFMLYETLFYRICKPYLYDEGDELHIDILNEDGIAISRLTLSQCKLDSISSLDFSYDKIERQSDDFTIDIVFNNIDYEFL